MSKILIADNENTARLQLRKTLAAAGHEVIGETKTGLQAVRMASKLKPDLVIINVVLDEDMDGVSAAEKIKEASDIPIVFMIDAIDPRYHSPYTERAVHLAPFGYLVKPFHETQVGALVETALYKSRMERDFKAVYEDLERSNQALTQEVLERKASERLLKAEKDKFQFLAENLVDIVWMTDINFQTTYVSPSVQRILGFTLEERGAQSLEEMITPESIERSRALLMKELQRETEGAHDAHRSAKIDVEYYRKDGSTVWMENCVKFIRNREGAVTGLVGSSRDISKRRFREHEIQRLRKEWQDIFRAIGNPAMIIDRSHRIIHANTASSKALGRPQKEIVGKKCHSLFHHSDTAPSNCPFLKMLKTGQMETVEMEIEALGATFLVSCTPMIDHDGRIEKVIHIATDISERKRMEEISKQLQHARKMEALATLTGGIAHDYNNLLSVIMGNLSLAEEDIAPGSEVSDFLKESMEASFKARDLTRELMALSRGGFPDKKPGSMDVLLRALAEKMFTGERYRWSFAADEDLWPLAYDEKQMQCAFTNILENAMEAMPQGGNVTVKIENRIIGSEGSNIDPHNQRGRYVRIVVGDEGKGIAEDNLDRIFDPYFSTKERGVQKGMGMGLTTAYAIVKKHEGIIKVDSVENKGTNMIIYLPALYHH